MIKLINRIEIRCKISYEGAFFYIKCGSGKESLIVEQGRCAKKNYIVTLVTHDISCYLEEKKRIRVAGKIENGELDQEYWAIVKRQFKKNRPAVWSLRFLAVLIFIALFGDFIANEKPLYCKIEGKTYFPVVKQYAVDLGFSSWEAKFVRGNWHDFKYDAVLYPPVPYSYHTIDLGNDYANPLKKQ